MLGGKSAPEARDWWFEVTVVVEVNIKVTAVMPVYFTPQSQPWLCPSFHPRHRGWNVTKLNCSQPPFAASVRHCLGLLSSFQSFSPFSSQAVLSKSPFGCAKAGVCLLIYRPFHRVFWCPLAESFPDSGSVGLFDSCNLSRPGQWEIRQKKSHYQASDFHLDRHIDVLFPPQCLCLTFSDPIPPCVSNIPSHHKLWD